MQNNTTFLVFCNLIRRTWKFGIFLAICMRHGFLPGGIQPGGGLAVPGPTSLKSDTFKTLVIAQAGSECLPPAFLKMG